MLTLSHLLLHDAAIFGPPLITCFDSSSPAAFHRDVLKLAPSPASALWSSKNRMRHVSSLNVQILRSGPVVVIDIKIRLVECRLPEVRVRIIDWYQLIKVTHVTKVWIGTIRNSSHFVKFQCHFNPEAALIHTVSDHWSSTYKGTNSSCWCPITTGSVVVIDIEKVSLWQSDRSTFKNLPVLLSVRLSVTTSCSWRDEDKRVRMPFFPG